MRKPGHHHTCDSWHNDIVKQSGGEVRRLVCRPPIACPRIPDCGRPAGSVEWHGKADAYAWLWAGFFTPAARHSPGPRHAWKACFDPTTHRLLPTVSLLGDVMRNPRPDHTCRSWHDDIVKHPAAVVTQLVYCPPLVMPRFIVSTPDTSDTRTRRGTIMIWTKSPP